MGQRQDEAGKSLDGELGQLKAQLGKIQTEASNTSGAFEQRLKQSTEQAAAQQSELADELVRLAENIAGARTETAGRIETLEQCFAQRADQSDTRVADLAGEVKSLNGRLDAVQTEASGTSSALEDRIKQLVDGSAAQISALTNRLQNLSEGFANGRTEAARSSDALEQRVSVLQESLHRLDVSDASATFADKLEMLAKGLDEVRAKASDTSSSLEHLVKQSASQSDQQLLDLSGKLESLSGVLDGVQKDASRASESVEQRLAQMQQGLKSISQEQVDTASTLAQTRERDLATAASISRLEEIFAKLETRLSERALDERVAGIERNLMELLSRTSAGAQQDDRKSEHPLGSSIGLPPFAKPPVAHVDTRAAVEVTPDGRADVDASLDSESSDHPGRGEDGHGEHAENGQIPSVHAASAQDDALGDVPPVATSTNASDNVGSNDRPKPSTSYLSAAREAANAASRAKAEVVGDSLLDSHILGSSQSSDARRFGKLSAGLAAAVGLVAVLALGAGVYLSFSPGSPRVIALNGPAGSVVAPKRALVRHAGPSPASNTVSGSARSSAAIQNTGPARDADSWNRIATLAHAGDAHAELVLGLHNLSDSGGTENAAEAARWLQLAAAHGEAIAQFRLGTLYAVGRGVPADATKAFELYKSAAGLGNRKAMYNLAVAYLQGSGTTKNLPEAVRWFSNAARLGLIDAQFDLAVLYERGTGVPQSLPDAYRWYAIAAKGGDMESKDRIDALNTQLSSEDRAVAEAAAAQFKVSLMDAHANVLSP